MKKFNTRLFSLLCLMIAGIYSLSAQDNRYLAPVFDNVEVQSGITYGVNATVLFAPQVGEAIPQELLMDFYQPEGDTASLRPLVLVLHTGNFLPIVQNAGLQGERIDSSTVEVATRLAKLGYVAAALDYRQGWNPVAETQEERTLTLLQASYRGIQDTRTAVRFFKKDVAENGNTFKVDTSKIVVWGIGTGGYVSLATATLDDFAKIATTTNPQGKFLTEFPPGSGTLVPMVLPQVNGDIYGLGVGILPIATSGLPAGDTLNYPNWEGYNSDIQLAVNMGGALGDISWLTETSQPIMTFQTPTDPFAPYEDAVLIVPTTGDPVVQVQGGRLIGEKASQLGTNDIFADSMEVYFPNDPYTLAAKAASEKAGHAYYDGLYPFIRATNINGEEEGDPWTWWDSTALAPGLEQPVPWYLLPHPTDPTGQTSFHENALLNNADMSPEKAKTYIDTIMGYFAPRACFALGLYPSGFLKGSSVDLIDDQQVGLEMMPNPAYDQIRINTGYEYPMQSVQVFDMSGRVVRSHTNINNNTFYIQRGELPPGMYVTKLYFEEGVLAKQIIFQE